MALATLAQKPNDTRADTVTAAPAAADGELGDRVELLLSLALIHADHGQARRALTYALLAHTFAPAHELPRRALAFALLKNGAPDEALETLQPLRSPSENASITLLAAECHRALGQPEAARDAFWRALGRAAGAAGRRETRQ